MNDPFVGSLTFFRVYSGTLETGATVYNAAKGKRERIGRLLRMHANKREDIKEVFAGNIAAAVGLRMTTTGDTLCDEKRADRARADGVPAPVISIAIEPKTKADQDKLGMALAKLAVEDPSSASRPTPRPARRSSPGWASCTWRSSSTACCASSRSRPTSAGRRSPTARPSPRGRGGGQVHPPDRRPRRSTVTSAAPRAGAAAGRRLRERDRRRRHPAEFMPAVERGMREALSRGVLAGYPVIDVAVTLPTAATTRSTPARSRSRSPARWPSRRRARGRSHPARAHDAGRGPHPGGVHGRGDRRPERAARPDFGMEARRSAQASPPRCRWPPCSGMPPTSAP